MNTFYSELCEILNKYQNTFSNKIHHNQKTDVDVLMRAFNISVELKKSNSQYYSRELGMIWQRLITSTFSRYCSQFYSPALRIQKNEPCDLIYKQYAIDTKYRIGSGDSGTLKKFKEYGELLTQRNYIPLLLILRTDNLHNAIKSCEKGNWQILTGTSAFDFVYSCTGFDLYEFLDSTENQFHIS